MGRIRIYGVHCDSAWSLAHELETVRRMLLELPAQLRAAVASVYVDSKYGGAYLLYVKNWDVARAIGKRLDAAALKLVGGHSGIEIRYSQSPGLCITVEPNWDFDF